MTDRNDVEDLDVFKSRARTWVADHLEPLDGADPFMGHAKDDADQVVRAKAIQRELWEGGFSGLCYPAEYGGPGTPNFYQQAFNEASRGYELPILFNTPTLTIITPTLLDFGTEEQKQRFIPAVFRGDELWVQFLSEPSGGSDLAGALRGPRGTVMCSFSTAQRSGAPMRGSPTMPCACAEPTGMCPNIAASAS